MERWVKVYQYSPFCQASMLSLNIASPNASGPASGSMLGFVVQTPALFTSLITDRTVSLCLIIHLVGIKAIVVDWDKFTD